MVSIDVVPVVIGTIGYQVLGMLWYGPLFGNRWMAGMGYESSADVEGASNVGYLVTAIGALVATLALAVLVDLTAASTWQDGLVIGLLAGVGFVATTAVQAVPFEGQSPTVYALNVGYNALALAGIAVLLTVW